MPLHWLGVFKYLYQCHCTGWVYLNMPLPWLEVFNPQIPGPWHIWQNKAGQHSVVVVVGFMALVELTSFLWDLENGTYDIFLQIWHSPGISVTSAFSVTDVKCIDFEHFANLTFSRYQRNTENMDNVHFSRSQCNIANMTFSRCFCGNEGPGIWGLNYWNCQG